MFEKFIAEIFAKLSRFLYSVFLLHFSHDCCLWSTEMLNLSFRLSSGQRVNRKWSHACLVFVLSPFSRFVHKCTYFGSQKHDVTGHKIVIYSAFLVTIYQRLRITVTSLYCSIIKCIGSALQQHTTTTAIKNFLRTTWTNPRAGWLEFVLQ